MSANPDHIPNEYVFVFDDNFLPYGAYLAMKSIGVRCRPDAIRLLKTPAMNDVPLFQRLMREVPSMRPVDIDLAGWLEEARLPCKDELLKANVFLKQHNFYGSVSDMLRTLWLYLHGGVYLDTDTLTMDDLSPLQAQSGFLAEEHILVSSKVYKRNSPLRYFKTSPLTVARDVCSKVAWGVGWWNQISRFYVRVVHNAVMGFKKGHPLMRDVLLRIAEKYPKRPERYPLLGPDTIQDLIEENTYDGLTIYPPHHFSPLGPTMTYQYFHLRSPKRIDILRRQVITPDTRCIHWSNNGTIAKATPKNDEDLKNLADRQLFSRLALEAAFPNQMEG